jgi:hypothetical protein
VRAGLGDLAGGHPGGGEVEQQLAPFGFVGRGLEVERSQRPLVVAGGLLVGKDLHRPIAGLPGVGHGLVGLARTRRLGEVVRQLGQVSVEVVTAEFDQGRSHPVVEPPPFP